MGNFRARSTLAGLLVCLLAGSAQAQDRPDLLDVDDEAYRAAKTSLPPNVNYSYAYAGAEEYDSISASGLVYGNEGSRTATITWHIFEPDSIKRKSDSLALKQKNYLGLVLTLYDGVSTVSFSPSSVEGCKAAMKVTGPSTNNSEGRWKVNCKLSTVDNALGLSESQLQVLEDIFGNKLNFKGKGAVLP